MSVKCSIIVPVYNAAGFLNETIQSVVDQTYDNWELILVNDGSSDESPQLIGQWKNRDKRIQGLTKENGGQASARNMGIRNAKGKYIALLDADDLWYPEKLEKQMELMEEDDEIGLCFTGGSDFISDPEKSKKRKQWKTGKLQGRKWLYEIYSRSGIINSSVVVRKTLFDEVGYFDESEEQRGTEDADLWLKFVVNDVCFFGMEEPLVFYRDHDEGIHRQKIRMYKGKLRYYKKYDQDPQIPGLLRKRQYRFVYRELMNLLYKAKRYEELKSIFKEFTKKDPYGWGTFKQRLTFSLFPLKTAMWISNKITYRIAYRLEKVTYFIAGI